MPTVREILQDILLPALLATLVLFLPLAVAVTVYWETTGENVCYDVNLFADDYCAAP